MTVTGLRGPAVSSAVVGDDAVAALKEEQHLGVPVVGRERPAMAEDDRFARAPVLVEDLRAVGRGYRGHALSPLCLVSGAVGLGCADKLAPPGMFVLIAPFVPGERPTHARCR